MASIDHALGRFRGQVPGRLPIYLAIWRASHVQIFSSSVSSYLPAVVQGGRGHVAYLVTRLFQSFLWLVALKPPDATAYLSSS
jgi:hypothetical protein